MPERIILVADDDEASRRYCQIVLTRLGYQYDEATNGFEAYERALAQPPDLVLMDLMMPGTDGLAAVRMFRADPKTSDIPIFILTAIDTMGACEECLAAGANSFLNKPINKETLYRAINGYFEGVDATDTG